MKYSRVILDNIEKEKMGIDFRCPDLDKAVIHKLFEEINLYAGTNIQYLAELAAFNIPGSGEIIARYINSISSESVKAILITQLVTDRVKDCDKLLLDLYLQFKASSDYISAPGVPAPAHIYTRYDNAFRSLKPRRLKDDLVILARCPRDAFYLPFTMRMLASWKVPALEKLFILYSSHSNVTEQDVGIEINDCAYWPPLAFIKRELRFLAIDALKYYRSDEVIEILTHYTTEQDPDIKAAAKKTLKAFVRTVRQGT